MNNAVTDFAAYEFARHPNGLTAIRLRSGGRWPWVASDESVFSDEGMVERGWEAVTPAPTEVTDEMVDRAVNSWMSIHANITIDGAMRLAIHAALGLLTPRDLEAEKLAPIVAEVLEKYLSGDLNGVDVPGAFVSRGVRVVGDEND